MFQRSSGRSSEAGYREFASQEIVEVSPCARLVGQRNEGAEADDAQPESRRLQHAPACDVIRDRAQTVASVGRDVGVERSARGDRRGCG